MHFTKHFIVNMVISIFLSSFLIGCLYAGKHSADTSNIAVDKVLILKEKHKLFLFFKDKIVREYHVALGKSPKGKKTMQGDRKTPEGNYTLDFKKADSSYYRAIHISYPSAKDKENAKKLGINPGGAIMLHGQPNGWGWLSFIRQRFNWTSGCIAVSNRDMDEIWRLIKPGTPIEIRK